MVVKERARRDSESLAQISLAVLGGQRSKDIVIIEKAEPGTLWLLRPNQISGSVREPPASFKFLPAGPRRALFKLELELPSLLHLLERDHPARIRVFPLSCPPGLNLLIISCYPFLVVSSLLSRFKCIFFRRRYAIWDLHKPRSSHNCGAGSLRRA